MKRSVGVRGEVQAGTVASRPPGWLGPVTERILPLFTCGPGALGHTCLVENRLRVTGPHAKGRLKKAARQDSRRAAGAASQSWGTRGGPAGRGHGLKSVTHGRLQQGILHLNYEYLNRLIKTVSTENETAFAFKTIKNIRDSAEQSLKA